jgi:hypothetical protein
MLLEQTKENSIKRGYKKVLTVEHVFGSGVGDNFEVVYTNFIK